LHLWNSKCKKPEFPLSISSPTDNIPLTAAERNYQSGLPCKDSLLELSEIQSYNPAEVDGSMHSLALATLPANNNLPSPEQGYSRRGSLTLKELSMMSMKPAFFRALSFFTFLLVLAPLSMAKDPKMDPKELISKHLQSIGTPEKLAARKTCVFEGQAMMHMISGGTGQLIGPAMLASEGKKIRYDVKFSNNDYPNEQFSTDGQNVGTGFVTPGRRSRLGHFLYLYRGIVREGLVGGSLTTAWSLLDVEGRNPRLQYNGLKNVHGKNLHEMRYMMRKGENDLSVHLYFEPETFRHVATVYRLVLPLQTGSTPEASSGMKETRYEIEEQFDNFQAVEGLTLPFHWNIHFTYDAGVGASITEWDMIYDRAILNQPVDPQLFTLK
jgi:hypothetical protein